MPLAVQSLKIEFSYNNCALQEVFFNVFFDKNVKIIS